MRGPADLLAWRAEFPAVEQTVFLGAHTLAPASRRTRAAVERYLSAWESKASAERVWFEDIIPAMRRAEALYAGIVGADADEVVLLPSVTTALSTLGSCFSFDRPRNEVVVSRREFPTDQLVWLGMEARGARVMWAEGRDAGDYAALLSDRTAIVEASRVSYLDAALLDAAAFVDAARAASAFGILDDFHGSGIVPIDVHALGVDAVVCGPYKYLLGSSNLGFLYVRRDRIGSLEPAGIGWFAQRDFFAFDGTRIDRPENAQRFAQGTPAALSVFASVAGLEIVTEIGVSRIRERSLQLTAYLIERADGAGLTVRTPRDDHRRGGLVAIEVPDAKDVLEKLLAAGVVVDERHGALRVCPHFYSSEDDVDALFDALRGVGIGR